MSKFVGKTVESINSILGSAGLFLSNQDKASNAHAPARSCSVDSRSFIRRLKNVESKQDEDNVIKLYSTAVLKRLSEPNVSNAEIAEMIKMCMTCEVMGYPTEFIYVHCLKLAQQGNLQGKHTGYLAASLFLHPHHELVLLLINTIQKDLCSSNHVEVLLALSSVCHLINSETVLNVFHVVEERLKHDRLSVRKSAILTYGHCLFLINSPSAFQMSIPKLEEALADKELEVVAVAVSTVYKIIQMLPSDFSYLNPSLVELQEQILLRRVPRSMVYCDIPAPWLQLDILKVLNVTCKTSIHFQEVLPTLKKTMQQVGLQNTLSHAIMYQLIEVITHTEPGNELIELVLSSVSAFLKSKNTNLKLTGVESLILVVQRLKPSITSAQQEIIMECLKLPDETLQLKTLGLLFHLANPSNVEAICKKLMEFLLKSTHTGNKKELALKVLELAIQFKGRQEWFVLTTISILMDAGQLITPSDIFNVINIISEDDTLKEITKNTCLYMCKNDQIFSPSLLKLTASILSTPAEFEKFSKLFLNADEEASIWFMVSLFDSILRTKEMPSSFVSFFKKVEMPFESSAQIQSQILLTIENLSNLQELNINEEIDPSLSFLDDFVLQALEKDSHCYLPSSFRENTKIVNKKESDPDVCSSFESSFALDSCASSPHKTATYNEFSSLSMSFQSLISDKDSLVVEMPRRRNVWTEKGRKSMSHSEECPTEKSDESPANEGKDEDLKDLFAGVS